MSLLYTMLYLWIFHVGRYNKYSRELSQSPWFIDGERKGLDTSVSELLSQLLLEYTQAKCESSCLQFIIIK